jgi:hypothetical protein
MQFASWQERKTIRNKTIRNKTIRNKTIRNKRHFPSDDAATKLICLALRQIETK